VNFVRILVVAGVVAAGPAGAFDNLDFEQIDGPPSDWASPSTGWRLVGALGPNLDGIPNLSGWAEGYRTSRSSPATSSVIEGDYSVAFESSYARWVMSGEVWPGWEDLGYTGTELIGQAFIAQAGWIELGVTALSFWTDYAGPRYPDASAPPWAQDVGELALYFDDEPISFRMEAFDVGGWALNRVIGDLRPFAGRFGELRLGVEGPHRFLVDDLRFEMVPESGGRWMVGGMALALALHARVRARGSAA